MSICSQLRADEITIDQALQEARDIITCIQVHCTAELDRENIDALEKAWAIIYDVAGKVAGK